MLEQLFRALDARAALGLRIWEFSWRSLSQTYGRTVLRRVVARHPLRTLAGLRDYRRWLRCGQGDGPVWTVGGEATEVAQGASPLVALGYCQKPADCPAGRFSPDCRVLAAPHGPARLSPVCAECAIRAVGERALVAGAALYVMTSAQQIARDLFLPALSGRGFRDMILALCPLSVQPMALLLHICRTRGLLLGYGPNACNTMGRWLAADQGELDGIQDGRFTDAVDTDEVGHALAGNGRILKQMPVNQADTCQLFHKKCSCCVRCNT
jgi:hypothetical protein